MFRITNYSETFTNIYGVIEGQYIWIKYRGKICWLIPRAPNPATGSPSQADSDYVLLTTGPDHTYPTQPQGHD